MIQNLYLYYNLNKPNDETYVQENLHNRLCSAGSICIAVGIPISTIAMVTIFRFILLPLRHNDPCKCLQHKRDGSQSDKDSGVNPLPLFLRLQHLIKALVYVDNAQDDHGISNAPMVEVPIQSVLVILLGPQKQGKYLKFKEIRLCQKLKFLYNQFSFHRSIDINKRQS